MEKEEIEMKPAEEEKNSVTTEQKPKLKETKSPKKQSPQIWILVILAILFAIGVLFLDLGSIEFNNDQETEVVDQEEQEKEEEEEQEEPAFSPTDKLRIVQFLFEHPAFIGQYYSNVDQIELMSVVSRYEMSEWPENTIPEDIFENLAEIICNGEVDLDPDWRLGYTYIKLDAIKKYLKRVANQELDSDQIYDGCEGLILYLPDYQKFVYSPPDRGIDGPFTSFPSVLLYGDEWIGWTLQIETISKNEDIYQIKYNRYFYQSQGEEHDHAWSDQTTRQRFVVGQINHQMAELMTFEEWSNKTQNRSLLADDGGCFVLRKVADSFQFIQHTQTCP